MNYLSLSNDDVANGDGIRVSLWVSGCDIRCKGCHNPESWDYNAGQEFTVYTMKNLIAMLDKSYIDGLTITGGHPLAPKNTKTVSKIIQIVRWFLPEKKIWLYTGYSWENINFREDDINYIISNCDIVVDGEYKEENRDISLKFKGSTNQRIIDVQSTLKAKSIILHE